MAEVTLTEATTPAPPRSYGPVLVYALFTVVATAGSGFLGFPVAAVAGGLTGVALMYVLRRYIFTWEFLLFSVAVVIMFVPARAYALPVPLPFQLEPYRLLWVLGLFTVLYAVTISRKLTWRPAAFGWGLGAYLVAVLMSFTYNASDLAQQGLIGGALGGVLSFLLLLVPFVIIRPMLNGEQIVRRLLVFLVWSGVVVSFFALVEYATRINVFRLYDSFLPLVALRDEVEATTTTGAFRSFGSSQHPIALAVVLSMLIPIALWLARWGKWPRNPVNRGIVYTGATIALFGGIMMAISRTAVIALGIMFVVTLVLRPRLAGRILLVAVPLLALLALVRPNLFNTVFGSFLDLESLIASQYTSPGWAGQGRLADIGPAMEIVARQPFVGTGLGSRIVVGENANSFILDNQWLATLMELGVLGILGLTAFLVVPVVKLLRFALFEAGRRRYADLAFAIVLGTIAYAVTMYFFDAFSFIQSFLVLSLLWAVGAWLVTETPTQYELAAAVLDDVEVGRP